ncbi:hypothetical protein [Vibrio campbellii]|uniref:hypothetical protein n=1 Tax=Vibrio campbellii TaxID=680 RepID=UPI001F3D5A5B|nr:hypothetical protein [Vibrio campbellii]MCE7732605.1 hypothetical protein [Vibrio campbellii]
MNLILKICNLLLGEDPTMEEAAAEVVVVAKGPGEEEVEGEIVGEEGITEIAAEEKAVVAQQSVNKITAKALIVNGWGFNRDSASNSGILKCDTKHDF